MARFEREQKSERGRAFLGGRSSFDELEIASISICHSRRRRIPTLRRRRRRRRHHHRRTAAEAHVKMGERGERREEEWGGRERERESLLMIHGNG
ncbi:hypothetical protein CRG98_006219 [Punica granatum]|uniref:Uncharacterized protein n=1 Tax=Punica granatum TaxID=22663 RepID=A0A2I0KXT4_PUNGR|nr:hypothetical protein CRG98_006219 [Punica granatum]